jgi:hypothetical protein
LHNLKVTNSCYRIFQFHLKQNRATRNQQILVAEVKENLNKDSKYIKDFVIRRGTELKLRKDRIQKIVNKFITN